MRVQEPTTPSIPSVGGASSGGVVPPVAEVFRSPWPGPGNSEGPSDPEGWTSPGPVPVEPPNDDALAFTAPWPGPGNSEASLLDPEPIRWLVDGMNVIGSRPDRWWQDPDGAVRNLIRLLERFAGASGDEVRVVFDRRPRGLDEGRHGAIQVAFATRPGRDAADDEIVRLVSTDPAPDGVVVVTSDRRLAERVQADGASVEPAGRFRRRLDAPDEVRSPGGLPRERPGSTLPPSPSG